MENRLWLVFPLTPKVLIVFERASLVIVFAPMFSEFVIRRCPARRPRSA